MHSTTLTIGWVSEYPRSPAATQERALAAFGITAADVVIDGRQVKGRSRETWAWLMKKARPGDTIAVTRLRAIYAPRGKETPRKALFRALHDLEDHGCKIVEISTGLHSSNARERDKMIAACLDELARSRSGGDAGRPPREWSAAEKDIVARHWFDIAKHATNAAAFKAIKADAKAAGLSRLARMRNSQSIGNKNAFGPSGRAKFIRKR